MISLGVHFIREDSQWGRISFGMIIIGDDSHWRKLPAPVVLFSFHIPAERLCISCRPSAMQVRRTHFAKYG